MTNIASSISRRDFLFSAGSLAAFGLTTFPVWSCSSEPRLFFKISLAEWSFNVSLKAGRMNNLEFPVVARKEFGLDGVEYVNQFFMDKAKDKTYLSELKTRCDDHGVRSLLIMCDSEGDLADTDSSQRQQSVENHFKWVDAAHFLGCHSIRVNCAGKGTPEEVAAAGTEGLSRLSEYAAQAGLNVIVENHGGYSSNGKWLSSVIRAVAKPNCGTLPDFGNFNLGNDTWYDRYQGVEEMMPFARAVSAKSHDFDAQGNCVETDYFRMLKIVKSAGYTGYIGIEYEGSKLSERDGIRATLELLKKAGAEVR